MRGTYVFVPGRDGPDEERIGARTEPYDVEGGAGSIELAEEGEQQRLRGFERGTLHAVAAVQQEDLEIEGISGIELKERLESIRFPAAGEQPLGIEDRRRAWPRGTSLRTPPPTSYRKVSKIAGRAMRRKQKGLACTGRLPLAAQPSETPSRSAGLRARPSPWWRSSSSGSGGSGLRSRQSRPPSRYRSWEELR